VTEEQIALAKRAVSCRGWRWLPGMLLADGVWRARVGEGWRWKEDAELLPVLDDHATLGCLLALVREAWGDPSLFVLFDHDGCKWRVARCLPALLVPRCRNADTEAEALVASLEAAP